MMLVEIKTDFIKDYMINNNLTKTKFSKLVHISNKTFDKFMNGEKVGVFTALRIAAYLEVEDKTVFDWNYNN